jgi:hypothetical protein
MAAPASPTPEDRGPGPNKRMRVEESLVGPPPEEGLPGYQPMPPGQRYPGRSPSGYGSPPPAMGPGGYPGMWGPHYGNGPPPRGYGGPPMGPGSVYRGPPTERPVDYYRGGGPPPIGARSSAPIAKKPDSDDEGKSGHPPYPSGPRQWHNPSYSYGPPPPGYTGSMQPMHAGAWSSRSPPRNARMQPSDSNFRPELDMSYLTTRTVGAALDDDGGGSSAGGSTKEKSRGSYKCGRVRCL